MMRGRQGFTLIELSIVLIIIGLVTSGILVGKTLIESAEIRATVADLEKYRTAANTFKTKYGGMPGDLAAPEASAFGFQPRSGADGHGDDDRMLEPCGPSLVNAVLGCEQVLFWRDLSDAKMINGQFNIATDALAVSLTANDLPLYLPRVRLTPEAYVVMYSNTDAAYTGGFIGNSFILAKLNSTSAVAWASFTNAITPLQAYNIDLKIDDGKPFMGTVKAHMANGSSSYLFGTSGPGTCSDVTTQYQLDPATRDEKRCIMLIKF